MTSKKTTNVPAEKVHVGEDATLYTQLVDKAGAATLALCKNQITWYWLIGQVFSEFNEAVKAGKLPSRTVEQFAADLSSNDIAVGTSTLYTARSIFDRYSESAIEGMVSTGLRVGHLKALSGLSDEAVKKIKLVDSSGKVLTIEKLTEAINEHKRKAAAGEIEVQRQPPSEAPATPADHAARTPPLAEEDLFGGSEGDSQQMVDGDKPPTGLESKTEDVAKKMVNDDGKTGSVGAGKPKEFSKSPLKALKALDNVSTKLTTLLPDVLIAVKEAGQVGFDHPKAQQNYRDCLNAAIASLNDALKAATPILTAMRDSADEQSR